jgi:hypothetical protein
LVPALWTGWSWQTRFSGLPGCRRYSVLKFNSERDTSATAGLQGTVGSLQTQITNLNRNIQSQITAIQGALNREIANANCVAGADAAQIDVCGTDGVCRTTKFSCFPYQCDMNNNACAIECSTSTDCATGFACVSNVCVAQPVVSCTPDHRSSVNNFTGDTRSCLPYLCDTSGLCLKTCATTDDCAPGFACCTSLQTPQCTTVC